MVEILIDDAPGLRERKKRRTRATLIDAAVQLCLDQGYANTTVEQIAAIADVSPRTFSRYFATKDAVVMTLLEDLVDAVAVELALIPNDVPVLEALRRAHVTVLTRVPSGDVPNLTSERIELMLRIINSTSALKVAATEFKPHPTVQALAQRMNVGLADRELRLVTAVWSSIIVTACGDLVVNQDGLQLGPELMAERIDSTFDHFVAFTADLAR